MTKRTIETELPADLIADLELVWPGHYQHVFAARVSVAYAAEPGADPFALAISTARRDMFRWLAEFRSWALAVSDPVWTRRPRDVPFHEVQPAGPPHESEVPWSPGEPVLLTDCLIVRITADTVPLLPSVRKAVFGE